MTLIISHNVALRNEEIEFSSIRAQGAGGQNVNKVSSAVHLRFDINASSLPEVYKERLLNLSDKRISNKGIVVIKAQKYRTQEKNREDALARLQALIRQASLIHKKRKPTRPSRASQVRRMDSKSRRGKLKQTRAKVI